MQKTYQISVLIINGGTISPEKIILQREKCRIVRTKST